MKLHKDMFGDEGTYGEVSWAIIDEKGNCIGTIYGDNEKQCLERVELICEAVNEYKED